MTRYPRLSSLLVLALALLAACGDDGRGPGDGSVTVDSGMGRDVSTGGCDPLCPAPLECCGGIAGAFCRDLTADPESCGECGLSCLVDEACVGGTCAAVDAGPGTCAEGCNSGFQCCGTSCINRLPAGVPLEERRSDISFMNCGACGMACDPTTASECGAPAGEDPQCLCGVRTACASPETCNLIDGLFSCRAL